MSAREAFDNAVTAWCEADTDDDYLLSLCARVSGVTDPLPNHIRAVLSDKIGYSVTTYVDAVRQIRQYIGNE